MPSTLIHVLFFCALVVLTGCVAAPQTPAPVFSAAETSTGKHFYVVKSTPDAHGLGVLIVQGLQRRGYDATAGLATDMPAEAAIKVAYAGEWQNGTLERLTIRLHDPRTDLELASGRSATGPGNASAAAARVDEALEQLFAP
ncbi:MAG: hypothetical protein WCZ87_12370 [Thiohalobacteraceae bacterium]